MMVRRIPFSSLSVSISPTLFVHLSLFPLPLGKEFLFFSPFSVLFFASFFFFENFISTLDRQEKNTVAHLRCEIPLSFLCLFGKLTEYWAWKLSIVRWGWAILMHYACRIKCKPKKWCSKRSFSLSEKSGDSWKTHLSSILPNFSLDARCSFWVWRIGRENGEATFFGALAHTSALLGGTLLFGRDRLRKKERRRTGGRSVSKNYEKYPTFFVSEEASTMRWPLVSKKKNEERKKKKYISRNGPTETTLAT